MNYTDWGRLPGKIAGRLAAIQSLVDICFSKGMVLRVEDNDWEIHFDDWREAVFGGRAATYLSFEKALYITGNLAWGQDLRYHPAYRADLHEWGHAVWALVLSPLERWGVYWAAWRAAKGSGRLLSAYSASKPEEGFAEDFEAILRDDYGGSKIVLPNADSWDSLPGRQSLGRQDSKRYNVLKEILNKRGLFVGNAEGASGDPG